MSADPRLARARAPAAATTPPPPPPPLETMPTLNPGLDGASDNDTVTNGAGESNFRLKFCTVCASNNNRYGSLFPLRITHTLRVTFQIYGRSFTSIQSKLSGHFLRNRISCPPSWSQHNSTKHLSFQQLLLRWHVQRT